MKNEEPTTALLQPSDVAREGFVTPATVRHWADQGWLPVIRTAAGRRLFRRTDVEEYLRARRTLRGERAR